MKLQILLVLLCCGTSTFGEFSSISLSREHILLNKVKEIANEGDNSTEANLVLSAIGGKQINNEDLLRVSLDDSLNGSLQLMAAKAYIKQCNFDLKILQGFLSDKSERTKYGIGLSLLAELEPSEECFGISQKLILKHATSIDNDVLEILNNRKLASTCAAYLVLETPFKKQMREVLLATTWNKNFRQFLFEYLIRYTELENRLDMDSQQIMERCIMEETDSKQINRMLSKMKDSPFKEHLNKEKKAQLNNAMSVFE